MKKILLALFVVVSILAVSCNKDKNESIVGKWQLESATLNGTPVTMEDCEKQGTIEFTSNGQAIAVDYCENPAGEQRTGTFMLKDGVLTVTLGGNTDVSNVSIEGNQLVLTQEAEGDTLVVKAKRI